MTFHSKTASRGRRSGTSSWPRRRSTLRGPEIELVPAFSREMRLRRALDAVRNDYDYMLIDCPPSLGLLTVNGLAAASEVIVPIHASTTFEGLGQLLRNVQLVQRNLNPGLELSAMVLVMYDARTKLADQVVREVRDHFGDKVCHSIVPPNGPPERGTLVRPAHHHVRSDLPGFDRIPERRRRSAVERRADWAGPRCADPVGRRTVLGRGPGKPPGDRRGSDQPDRPEPLPAAQPLRRGVAGRAHRLDPRAGRVAADPGPPGERRPLRHHRRRTPLAWPSRAGLQFIPVIVRQVNDELTLQHALVENLHRDDLNPLEGGRLPATGRGFRPDSGGGRPQGREESFGGRQPAAALPAAAAGATPRAGVGGSRQGVAGHTRPGVPGVVGAARGHRRAVGPGHRGGRPSAQRPGRFIERVHRIVCRADEAAHRGCSSSKNCWPNSSTRVDQCRAQARPGRHRVCRPRGPRTHLPGDGRVPLTQSSRKHSTPT